MIVAMCISRDTNEMKSAEVTAFMRLHRWTLDDALKEVVLSRRHYRPTSKTIKWLPTPTYIDRMTQAIKDGSLAFAGRQRAMDSDARHREEQATRIARKLELAGRLPDDSCPVPSWLYAGGSIDEQST